MRQRILILTTILTGAAGGTAVTAVNFYLRRKTSESEKEDRQNLDAAGKFIERADLAQEQSFLLQQDIVDFAKLSDVDKEKVMALVRNLAREEKDGPDVPDLKQMDDEETSRKSEEGSESVTPKAESEEEEEDEEKLMEEYWRRAKKVYGHGDLAHSFAENAKPVFHLDTSYGYISVADAAEKTGYPANYIRQCCKIPDPMGQLLFSDERKGGLFHYMSQTDYAKMPEERIEVDTREEKKGEDEEEDEEKLMAEYWRRAKKVYGHGDLAHGFAKNAKPVCQSHTGYAYISIADAAKKTGYPANYIRYCCNITDPMGKMFFSEEEKGGVFYYISQTEYARIPEDRIEVDPREQKTEEKKDDDIALTVTPQEEVESESVTPQASDNRRAADDQRETAEDKGEREKLVAEYLRRVESVYGQGKEARMMAASARPIRNTRTGYAYISISDAAKKTGLSARDIHSSCMSNDMRGDEWCYITQREYAKMPEEKVEVETKEQKTEEEKNDDTAPATPQATTEDEEEKLMAEYWRRAEKVYGRNDASHGALEQEKPVFNYKTGYAYISIADAAEKTGYSANYIRECCDIPDMVGKMFFSERKNGSVFGYMSQTEYAKKPEELTEVVTKSGSEYEEEKLMDEYWRRAKNVYGRDNRSKVWAVLAKPVRNSRTGYAYIRIPDAAIKTGANEDDIYLSCESDNSKDGEWCYITKTEYAKMPEEMTEVETKDQRTEKEIKFE